MKIKLKQLRKIINEALNEAPRWDAARGGAKRSTKAVPQPQRPLYQQPVVNEPTEDNTAECQYDEQGAYVTFKGKTIDDMQNVPFEDPQNEEEQAANDIARAQATIDFIRSNRAIKFVNDPENYENPGTIETADKFVKRMQNWIEDIKAENFADDV